MAAPKGNQNAAKGKEWAEAIRYALKTYANNQIKRGMALKGIAKKVVEKALEGDKDSIQEVGNRLDGKPVQAIEGTGENGEINVGVNIRYVGADHGKPAGKA
jgi:hypothetical protein